MILSSNFSYELPLTTVFAHPLLRTVAPIKSPFIADSLSSSSTHQDNAEDESKFVDPLSASSDDGGTKSATFSKLQNGLNSGTKADNKGAGIAFLVDEKSTSRHIADIDELAGSLLNNTLKEEKQEAIIDLDPQLPGFMPWRELREQILQEYKTTEKLSLESSFLIAPNYGINRTQFEKNQEKKRSILGSSTDVLLKFTDLSQDEYIKKLAELKKILHELWKQERRIDCIRLMAEIARTLASTSVPQFYPSQFVHITDLLDDFAVLVFQRLWSRAEAERKRAGVRTPLPQDFAIVDVLEQTRMTTRNWFGKIGEIRELIPRIYLECALLRCMRFMDPSAITPNLMRLCELACLIQHPLTASYARCYICRVALRLDFGNRAPGWKCLNDWLQTYTQQPTYLLWPAMQYIIECVAQGASTRDDLLPLWEYCRLPEKRAVVLCPMLNGVSHFYLAENALEACKLVTGSEHVTGDEICALGANFMKAQVPYANRKPILKVVWKCVMRLASLKAYVRCCDVWMEFVTRYFTVNELEIILENLMQKLLPEKKYELYYDYLLSIIRKILMSANIELVDILGLETFFKFLDLFRETNVRRKAASLVLDALVARHDAGTITDVNLAYQIKDICKLLSDGLNIFSPIEEHDQGSRLIRQSLNRVNLTSDPEQALAYYVACRAALLNNDNLQHYVVLRIFSLTLQVVRTIRFTTGRSTFIQACLANLFITIPSLTDDVERLRLGVCSAQLALAALAFLQVDEFVKFSLDVLSDISPANEEFSRLRSVIITLLSFLLEVPDRGSLSIFSRVVSAIKSWQWSSAADQARLLLDCLQFLFVNTQSRKSSSAPANDANVLQHLQWSHAAVMDSISFADQSKVELDAASAKYAEDFEVRANQLIEDIADTLARVLNVGKMAMLERVNICAHLVEIIAVFTDQERLPQSVRELAVEAFRRCKRAGVLSARRLKLLKMSS